MEKEEFRGEYLAPQVKVVEMKLRQQILNVSGNTEDYKDGTWTW